MEVKKVEVRENSVSMTFNPKGYDDIVMAEVIFGNIVAEQFRQEIFEPFPYEKSSFTEKEIKSMLAFETKFFYNEERGFFMKTSLDEIAELIGDNFQGNDRFKKLEDYKLIDNKFWIKCIQPEEELKSECGWIDVKYQVQVGEHRLETYISEWSTDWDQIRHDLEHLIWHNKTEIHLNFEDSPTRIILQKESALDSTVEYKGGVFYNWEPLIRIEVIPNDFVKNIEPFIGYEKQLNVINSIYHGLQSLANAYPDNNSDNSEMTKKNVSAKLHSQLIDEYINNLLKKQESNNNAKSMQQKLYNDKRKNE